MNNERLIRALQLAQASPGQLRHYADRVRRRKISAECEHGHFECALIHRGPCAAEAEAKADAAREQLEEERKKVAGRKREPSLFGKKGGTSATAGKRGFTYAFTFPDGTPGKRVSYQADGVDVAQVVVYFVHPRWHASGVYSTVPDWALFQLEREKSIFRIVEGHRVTGVSQRHKGDASALS